MKVLCLVVVVLTVSVSARPLLAPLYRHDINKKVPGRYIFALKDSASRSELSNVLTRVQGLAADRSLGINVQTQLPLLKGFVAEMTESAVKLIRSFDEIAYVEEDSMFSVSAVESWGLDRIDQVNLPLDGNFSPRGSGSNVNIYVIDTGIRYTHNDFGGRAQFFFDSFGGDGVDCNGHGTHCAGTAAGSNYGVAKSAKVWGLRVLTCQGFGFNSGIIAGMDDIVARGSTPGVVSMSLGGGASVALDEAVTRLKKAGFTVVVAAGNENQDACNVSPGRSGDAITVGATENTDARASYSNYGTCVDLFAPGSAITSAWYTTNDDVNTISGTSMACPHVAGASAILLGLNPSLSPENVKSTLESDATVGKVTAPGTDSPNLLLYIG